MLLCAVCFFISSGSRAGEIQNLIEIGAFPAVQAGVEGDRDGNDGGKRVISWFSKVDSKNPAQFGNLILCDPSTN